MSDITERLDKRSQQTQMEEDIHLMVDAKREIERLQAVIETELIPDTVAFRHGVAAERERCAKIVDKMLHYENSRIAAAIRGEDKT